MVDSIVGEIYDPRGQAFVKWKIENYFSLSQKADKEIESPSFHFSNASWYLSLYPNGERSIKTVGWVDLYLIRENSEMPNILDYNIGILSSDGAIYMQGSCTHRFNKDGDGYGSSLIKRNELIQKKNKIVPEGILTVFVNVKHFPDITDAACQTMLIDGTTSLSRDFHSLLRSERKSDVVIKVKSQLFRVHKLILETRSSVFAAMFQHNMKENSSGVVNIADCNPDIFKDFILFMYTGKIEKLSKETVFELFTLSDKYDLSDLQKICMNFMKENLCLEEVCYVMAIADRHNEEELKDSAKKLIVDNIKILLPTNQWISFMGENPVLAAELLMAAFPENKH